MTTPPRVADLRRVAIDAAAYFREVATGVIEVTTKIDGSPLTAVDLAVDAWLRQRLLRMLPEAGWLSEETADHPARLDHDWVWVVDPLDGTKEFARGIPEYAISIGLVHRGRAVAGAVVNPATGEGAAGSINEGCEQWGLTPVAAVRNLSDAIAIVSRTETDDGSMQRYAHLVGGVRPVGSVAYKLLRVAAGADGLTYSAQPKSEWDVCGGIALLAAAGHVYQRFDDAPLVFNSRVPRMESGAVAGAAPLVAAFLNAARPVRTAPTTS